MRKQSTQEHSQKATHALQTKMLFPLVCFFPGLGEHLSIVTSHFYVFWPEDVVLPLIIAGAHRQEHGMRPKREVGSEELLLVG